MTTDSRVVCIRQQMMETIGSSIDRLLRYTTAYIRGGGRGTIIREEFFTMEEIMSIYTECYHLSIKKDTNHADTIYRLEMEIITTFMEGFIFEELDDFLQQFHGFMLMIRWFSCMFHHVNRVHEQTTGLRALNILPVWIDGHAHRIHDILRKRWEHLRRRRCAEVDPVLMDAMHWIIDAHPGFYDSIHALYMEETQRHYARCREEFWSRGARSYTQSVMDFRREDNSMDAYLQERTRTEIRSLFVQEMFLPYYIDVLYDPESGWEKAIETGSDDDIAQLILFLQEGQTEMWTHCHQKYIHKRLSGIDRIEDLLTFFRSQAGISSRIPHLIEFVNILQKEIRQFMVDRSSMDHPLIRSLDILMRKRQYQEVHVPLGLIRLYPDQDHIQAIYRQYLARRLIDMNSPDDEERILPFYNDNLTYRLNITTMLNDARKNVHERGHVRLVMGSKILWGEPTGMVFPCEVVSTIETIHETIRQEHPMFRLELSALGSVILDGFYADGRAYEFIMSPLQATIILFLQTSAPPVRDWEELQTILRLPPEGKEACSLLASKRLPILEKKEEGFRLNPRFSSSARRHRIRTVPIPSQPTTSSSTSTTAQDTRPDLDYQMDAVMVHLIKRHQTLSHQDLIVRTGHALQSQNVRRMKERIASLIDRDYIGRSETDPQVYHYIP